MYLKSVTIIMTNAVTREYKTILFYRLSRHNMIKIS